MLHIDEAEKAERSRDEGGGCCAASRLAVEMNRGHTRARQKSPPFSFSIERRVRWPALFVSKRSRSQAKREVFCRGCTGQKARTNFQYSTGRTRRASGSWFHCRSHRANTVNLRPTGDAGLDTMACEIAIDRLVEQSVL